MLTDAMYRIIFEHHPKPGEEQAFIAAWTGGSDVIQTYPGARGTKLFRSLDNASVLYAIAEWESKPHRDAAMAAIEKLENGEIILRVAERHVSSVRTVASLELLAQANPPGETESL